MDRPTEVFNDHTVTFGMFSLSIPAKFALPNGTALKIATKTPRHKVTP